VSDDFAGKILQALDQRPPHELLDVLAEHLPTVVGTSRLWLADYEEATLEPLDFAEGGRQPSTSVDGPGAGRAFREQQPVIEEIAAGGVETGVSLHLPVTMRAERIGVLEVVLAERPDARQVDRLAMAATAVAYTVTAARRYTDTFELARRRRELELPAEMQWELLPVLAHDGPDFRLAGSVEPAYDIGGDNFDYSVEVSGVAFSLSDAMGHGTRAAMLSNLAVAAQRNARRHGDSLRQQVRAVNTAVHDSFGGEMFITGVFLQVERRTGRGWVVNAGHSLFWRLRGDQIAHVAVPPDLPAGLFAQTEYTAHPFEMAEGDRILLASDGVIEATDPEGEQYGTDRLRAHLLACANDPPTEVVRRLTTAVKDHARGHLADDATALCVDYRR